MKDRRWVLRITWYLALTGGGMKYHEARYESIP